MSARVAGCSPDCPTRTNLHLPIYTLNTATGRVSAGFINTTACFLWSTCVPNPAGNVIWYQGAFYVASIDGLVRIGFAADYRITGTFIVPFAPTGAPGLNIQGLALLSGALYGESLGRKIYGIEPNADPTGELATPIALLDFSGNAALGDFLGATAEAPPEPVPEPASGLVLLSGMAGLLWRGRKATRPAC